jgi:Tol biopolymer transport system component
LSRIFGTAAAIAVLVLGPVAVAATDQRKGVIVYSDNVGEGVFAANADGSGSRDLTHRASDGYPSPSPDGTRIVFDHYDEADVRSIVVVNADGSGKVAIVPDADGAFPVWSPDGALIAFGGGGSSDNKIYAVRPDGTGLRLIASDAPTYGVAWSPDSRLIAYGGSAGLTTVDISSGERRVLARRPGSWRPSWSPDGKQIAFVDDDDRVLIVSPDGSNLRDTHTKTGSETPSWSSDGTRLAVGDESRKPERVVVIDVRSGVTTTLTTSRFGESSGDPQWSSDGRIAFLRSQTPDMDIEFSSTDLWVMNGDGSGQVRLTSPFPTGRDAGELHWLSATETVVPDAPVRTVPAQPTRGFVSKTEQWVDGADATNVYMSGADQRLTRWSTSTGARRTTKPKPESACMDEEAVSGTRLTWLCSADGRDYYDRTLETASSFGSKPVRLMRVTSGVRDPMELAGSSSLVVYTAHGRLWRLRGTHSSLVRRVQGEVVHLSTDGRFIAIVHPHSIETVRANGAHVHTFPFSPQTWRSARVTNGQLLVVRRSAISVYRVTGEAEHSWAIKAPGPPAELIDARGRYAVYTAGIALRLLDLRNGRDVAIGLRNQVDDARAIFTGNGLAYVYRAGYGRIRFRAGFLAYTRLRAMLRSA